MGAGCERGGFQTAKHGCSLRCFGTASAANFSQILPLYPQQLVKKVAVPSRKGLDHARLFEQSRRCRSEVCNRRSFLPRVQKSLRRTAAELLAAPLGLLCTVRPQVVVGPSLSLQSGPLSCLRPVRACGSLGIILSHWTLHHGDLTIHSPLASFTS